MAFIGRLHPLPIHLPIALLLAAVAADGAAVFPLTKAGGLWGTVAALVRVTATPMAH